MALGEGPVWGRLPEVLATGRGTAGSVGALEGSVRAKLSVSVGALAVSRARLMRRPTSVRAMVMAGVLASGPEMTPITACWARCRYSLCSG
jgi:hypothetical protein